MLAKIDKFKPASSYYIFEMKNGNYKLAWGVDPQAAIDGLKNRLTDDEIAVVKLDKYKKIAQAKLPSVVGQLG